jgi:hypothetical protein
MVVTSEKSVIDSTTECNVVDDAPRLTSNVVLELADNKCLIADDALDEIPN